MPIEVWYAIPSASPERCRENLPAWRDMGYRVAVFQNRVRAEIPADITLWSDHYPGWAASVNHLCRAVVPRTAPIIVTGGDDMRPDPTRRAADIAADFFDRFPHTFGVMQPTGDDFMNTAEYCGSPWLGRAWIERAYRGMGPLCPEYHHNWADHELHCVAEALGVLWQRPDLTHEHRHFSRTGAEPPDYWRDTAQRRDRADADRFVARLLLGFPNHEPFGAAPIPAEQWRDNYRGPALRYWAAHHAPPALTGDSLRTLSEALNYCASAGHSRVAIYGAGTELRAAADALRDPPVRIVGIIDDAPRSGGALLWGFPVRPIRDAASLNPDAIIICARAAAERMHTSARALFGEHFPIIRPDTHAPQEACHA